jgi:hypothetical protein
MMRGLEWRKWMMMMKRRGRLAESGGEVTLGWEREDLYSTVLADSAVPVVVVSGVLQCAIGAPRASVVSKNCT